MDIGKELPITPGTIVFDVPSVAMVTGQRPPGESSELYQITWWLDRCSSYPKMPKSKHCQSTYPLN